MKQEAGSTNGVKVQLLVTGCWLYVMNPGQQQQIKNH
jgi:hypothetical protein